MKRSLVIAALCGTGLVALPSAAFAASGGYGPTAPSGPAGAPGGFTAVVASQQVGPAGGVITANVNGVSVTVTVPAGDFSSPVEVEVTAPVLSEVQSSLTAFGYSGYTAVAGLGVVVAYSNGSPVSGSFAKPITVTLTGSSLGAAGEKVLELTSSSTVTPVAASTASGSVSVSLTTDPDLVVVNPPATVAAVPGATTVQTGLPVTGLDDIAIGLAVLGLGSAALGVRHRKLATRR